MIAMFSRYREYIVVKISTYITPYLIESTLELLESTGVDLCTHVQYLCTNIALRSSANCPNKSGDDEVGFGDAFGVKCKIAQYRSISLNIGHYFENQPKIIAELFAQSEKMLYLCVRFRRGHRLGEALTP